MGAGWPAKRAFGPEDGVTVNTVQPGSDATARVMWLLSDAPGTGALGIPAETVGRPGGFDKVVAFTVLRAGCFLTAQIPVDGG